MRTMITTAALALLMSGVAALLPAAAPAAVKEVPVGILFSHEAPGAARVSLAGSFNDWNMDRNPMTLGDDGVWTIVMALRPGKEYQYKFVVDGSWLTDETNPASAGDGFGGVNSVVTLDAKGRITAAPAPAAATAAPGILTQLNAKLRLDGRYLGRYEMSRRKGLDPRFRLTRPQHSVDLNFHTEVSEVVDAYTRLRIDNERNINFSQNTAYFDEGAVDIAPGPFTLKGYWDMELLGLGDPLTSGGDVDFRGTLLDDHIAAGKGSSGLVLTGRPFGLDLDAFVANVHNGDWYNSLEIWDDTGRDVFAARLSREIGGVTVGVPLYAERDLVWMNEKYARRADGSAIAVFDEFQAANPAPFNSDWFEWGHRDVRFGLDLTRELPRGRVQLEWLHNPVDQGWVTRNNADRDAGNNPINGSTDIQLMARTRNHFHGSLDWEADGGLGLNLEHTTTRETGATPDDAFGLVTARHFRGQVAEDEAGVPTAYNLITQHYLAADQRWLAGVTVPPDLVLQATDADLDTDDRIYMTFVGAPPAFTAHYTELTLTRAGDGHHELIWLQHDRANYDFATVGAVSPSTGLAKADVTTWTLTGRFDYGRSSDPTGQWTLVGAWTDRDDEVLGRDGRTLEAILRFARDLSPRVQAIGDVRVKSYDMDGLEPAGLTRWQDTFWSPYLGVRYLPHPKLDVVAAYGVDPLSFGIDYRGRNLGREFWRRQYIDENPGTSEFAAERALQDFRAFGLRANFIF